MTDADQSKCPTVRQLKELYRTSRDADVVRACLVALGDAHYVLDGAPSDAECEAAEKVCSAALVGDGRPVRRMYEATARPHAPAVTVPISDLAHVVRNALTPARHYLEQPAYMPGSRVARAIEGIDAVLAFVDEHVRRSQEGA